MSKQHSSGHRRISDRSRKLAEWVTFGLSVALILALAGVLVVEAFRPNEPIISVRVTPLWGEVRQAEKRFVLPVLVENHDDRTAHDLKVEVSYQPEDAPPATTEALIDYLGERSSQKLFFYFDENPRHMQVKAQPASYRLE